VCAKCVCVLRGDCLLKTLPEAGPLFASHASGDVGTHESNDAVDQSDRLQLRVAAFSQISLHRPKAARLRHTPAWMGPSVLGTGSPLLWPSPEERKRRISRLHSTTPHRHPPTPITHAYKKTDLWPRNSECARAYLVFRRFGHFACEGEWTRGTDLAGSCCWRRLLPC
jgi:hypothetical protein